jgi:alanine racemase
MNLNYTLSTLALITKGNLKGNKDKEVHSIIIDSRSPKIGLNTLFVALKGNKTNGHDYCKSFIGNNGQLLLVSEEQKLPNVNQIIVENTLVALQKIAEYHRQQFHIPVIGITGSNGKTTVKEWLFHALKKDFNICRSPKSYNSQIGVALSVLELNTSHTLGVFEAGISQPGEMEKLESIIKPTIGIFTGIGDAHQQNFKSIRDKKTEKFKLFKSVSKLIKNESNLADLNIPFTDLASKQNANLVYTCGLELGLKELSLKESLINLPTISMRMERMEGKNGNVIINDAYTLDEKSLEIGINYLNTNSGTKDKVLIIAPHENSHFSNEIVALLNSLTDFIIVLIGTSNSYVKNITFKYKSVDDYLENQKEFKNSILLITGSRASQLEKIIPSLIAKKHITKLNIDLSVIRNNLNHYRSLLDTKTMILAMVKAQSYGGGIVEMAEFLQTEKINYFGVAYADEGIILRENNIEIPILVMNPELEAFDDIIDNNLEPSIYGLELLDQFIAALIRRNIKSFPIHLKLDTGMNRLGFVEQEIDELIAQLNTQPEVYVKSIFSHLSVADVTSESEFTNHQIEQFKNLSKRLKDGLNYSFIEHIANSTAIINYSDSHFDMVRLGIGMYGLIEDFSNELESVLSFQSQISQLKYISKNDSVGYGRTFKAKSDTTVAIIPVGYADGLRRALGEKKWSFLINDQLAPIIGNVCMDMCMVDVTNIDCKPGDTVEIFGPKNTVFKMAEVLNTIPYEIISSISNRVHRVYLEE